MAQDFANRYNRNPKEASKPRGAVVVEESSPNKLSQINLESLLGIKLSAYSWLALGLLIGCLLGYYLALISLTDQLKIQHTEISPNTPHTEAVSEPLAQEDKPPKFEFYTQLITTQVETPSIDAYKSTPRQATDVPSYLIQAGSFNKFSDAVKQQERIKNLKLAQVEIKAIETSSGETWYRIQLGPSQDRRELARIQNTLNTAGIESFRVKLQENLAKEQPVTKQPAKEQPIAEQPATETPQDTSLDELGNL